MPLLTIREIKEDILRRAQERQASVARGAYDVPLHYSPLPLAKLLDLLSQLEYRHNFLDLAVPPPHPAFRERFKRFFKDLICKCFRWLLIRQVEFNTVALEQARAAAELMAVADRDQGEFKAAVIALRLQVNCLAQRIAQLEIKQAGSRLRLDGGEEETRETSADKNQVYPAYLHYLKGHEPLLIIGCDRGDLLKLLVSEGIAALGIETDPILAEYCRERELPVIRAEASDYLGQITDGGMGGIYLGAGIGQLAPRALADLLGTCWTKLAKGGVLIAQTENPRSTIGDLTRLGRMLPVELLSFLFESQSFTIVDYVFSLPANTTMAEVAQTSTGRPFDRNLYGHYAIVGRK